MNHIFLRYCAPFLLMVGVFWVSPAHAYNITCTNPTMTDLTFGNVDPQSTQTDVTATFSTSCYNDAPITLRSALICLSIGQPRQMTSGSAKLNFQLYQDASRSIIWGSQFSGPDQARELKIRMNGYETRQINTTLYGRVLAGQTTTLPGVYTKSFLSATEARMTVVSTALQASPMPEECRSNPGADRIFPFTVSANVVNKCRVSASPLDFGTNPGLLNTAVNANTNLTLQCSVGTAYNVGLNAGQNGGGDINARKMMLGANHVAYQLYRDPAQTQVWGDTIGSNTVAATGNGSTQNMTVYGNVQPQPTPPAGIYKDTVIVTVTY